MFTLAVDDGVREKQPHCLARREQYVLHVIDGEMPVAFGYSAYQYASVALCAYVDEREAIALCPSLMAECYGVAVLRGNLWTNNLVDFRATVEVENLNYAVGIVELKEHPVVACGTLTRLAGGRAFAFTEERTALRSGLQQHRESKEKEKKKSFHTTLK